VNEASARDPHDLVLPSRLAYSHEGLGIIFDYSRIISLMQRFLFLAAFPPLVAATLACTAQTDAVSQHINACLLLTEAEVAIAIGAPVSAPEKRSDTQCLYHAKGNSDETVVIDIDQEPSEEKRERFNQERKKHEKSQIAGLGDAAFTSPAPPRGIHLAFMKNDALVTVTVSATQHGRPAEAVTNLGKSAATRLAAQLSSNTESASISLPPLLSSVSWTGDWYGCPALGQLNAKGRLTFTSSGGWSMTAALVTTGTLLADKGQWQVESFQDILHGTYQLHGKDSFTTTGILSVKWDKVSKNQGPTRFDRALYKALAGVPQKLPVKRFRPVEPALLGTWEASARYVDHTEEFVWSISSNNLSQFYRAILWSGETERDGDRYQLVAMPAKTVPFRMKQVNQDTLELTDSQGIPSQWSRKDNVLARC
jgi:hypothetical protein